MLTHRISCRAAGLCVSPTPAVNADGKRIADCIRNDAEDIQAFFSALFFVWRPPHPLHPHLLCTRQSEAWTESLGAVVCWSTAPNPRNHAVRRMTGSPMFYRLAPMLPRCAGRMLLKPENTAAKQMSDKCQTNNLAQKGLSA